MKIKAGILYLACFASLFITPTTAEALGVSAIGSVSYGFFVLLFLHIIIFDTEKVIFSRFKAEYIIIGIFIVFSFIQASYLGIQTLRHAFFFLVVPMLVSVVLQLQSPYYKIKITRIIIFFYFAQCGLAIYERLVEINMFPYFDEEATLYVSEGWQFRSTAFLGHPLNNALCTSTILGFILVSGYSIRFKLLSSILGLGAVLSFNARGAVIVLSIVIAYYFYLFYNRNKERYKLIKLWFILGLCLSIYCFYVVLTQTDLGGRLINSEKLIDGSAQTRLDVLAAFDYIKGLDFWVGNPYLYMSITDKLGAAGIENSYVVIVLRYGMIFGIPVIISLFFFLYNKTRYYRYRQRLIIYLLFIGIGSMNNSLAGVSPWIIFILCVQSFPSIGFVKRYRYMQRKLLIKQGSIAVYK